MASTIAKSLHFKRAIRIVPTPLVFLHRGLHEKSIDTTWKRPEKGWMKLNYDGSCRCKTGISSIGGIFRDHQANFVLGYAQCIGQSNSTVAEIHALIRGLEIALDNDWRHLWLEGDSKTLVDIITEGRSVRCREVMKNVARVNMMLREIESFDVTHTYRQGNRAADRFAQMGYKFKETQIWRRCPDNVLRFVDDDARGKGYVRRR